MSLDGHNSLSDNIKFSVHATAARIDNAPLSAKSVVIH